MGKMREKMSRFMAGRYGVDDLGRLSLYVSLGLLILSMFVRYRTIYILALLILGIGYFRMFSRNVARRYEENQKFLTWRNHLLQYVYSRKKQRADREHRYYRCPSCHQTVRVPRGKGKISITCPKCRKEFIKRT